MPGLSLPSCSKTPVQCSQKLRIFNEDGLLPRLSGRRSCISCIPINHISSSPNAITSHIATLSPFFGGFKNVCLKQNITV